MKLVEDLIIGGAEVIKMSERLQKNFAKHERNNGELKADKFKGLKTDERVIDGCFTITVYNEECTNKHIFFLHGGGYVAEATSSHRRVIEDMVKNYHLKVTFVDYPLAPENNYKRTHEAVMKIYKKITTVNSYDKFYLFGDSAGGGLALAFLQRLRDYKVFPFPKKTVLVSPWVDLTMSTKGIEEAAQKDPLLSMDILNEASLDYSGGDNRTMAIMSPLNGRMDNLGDIFLLVGTHEILNPECRMLKNKLMTSYGTNVIFYEGEKMVHDWILAVPVYPEAIKAMDMIGNFYNEEV